METAEPEVYYYELPVGMGHFTAFSDVEALLKMPSDALILYVEVSLEEGMRVVYEKPIGPDWSV
jgi:hypothetical protein